MGWYIIYNSTQKKPDTFSLAVNKSYMYVPELLSFWNKIICVRISGLIWIQIFLSKISFFKLYRNIIIWYLHNSMNIISIKLHQIKKKVVKKKPRADDKGSWK